MIVSLNNCQLSRPSGYNAAALGGRCAGLPSAQGLGGLQTPVEPPERIGGL